jgi:cytochrome c6
MFSLFHRRLTRFSVQRGLFMILGGLFLLGSVILWPAQVGFAAEFDQGRQIFQANCRICHIGGKNLIFPDKNLSLAALQANQMNSLEAIARQVTYGKNIMPAFGEQLTATEIQQVATYVLDQAQTGWPDREE